MASNPHSTAEVSGTNWPWLVTWVKWGIKPILAGKLIAPPCVLQLVKCGCLKSICKGNCSCRINIVQCTELCVCEADAENVKIILFCVIPTIMNLIQLYFVKLKLGYYAVQNYLEKNIEQLFCIFCMKDTNTIETTALTTRQWSKMAAKKCQDVFLAISDNNLFKKSCWHELRKKSHDGFLWHKGVY